MGDVKQSAERLRRIYAGEPSQCVYGSENAIETTAMKREDKDAVILHYASLLETLGHIRLVVDDDRDGFARRLTRIGRILDSAGIKEPQ